MRLGELLIQENILESHHVDQARARMQDGGGRIGTNLIELGFANHDQIALALSKQKSVPAAMAKHFAQIDSRALQLLNSEQATRFVALPFAFAKTSTSRRVVVCFRDPDDRAVVSEVEALAGLAVVAAVAPERSIFTMLHRCYGAPLPRRLDDQAVADADIDISMDIDEEDEPQESFHGLRLAMLDDESVDKSIAGHRRPVATPLQHRGEAAASESASAPEPPAPQEPETYSLAKLRAQMETLSERDLVAQTILDFLRPRCEAALLLQVKGDLALGYKGFGGTFDPSNVESIVLPLSESSLVSECIREKKFRVGSPASKPSFVEKRFLKLFHPTSKGCAALPIQLGRRVAMAIYMHGDALADIEEELASLQDCTKAAFTRIIRLAKRG